MASPGFITSAAAAAAHQQSRMTHRSLKQLDATVTDVGNSIISVPASKPVAASQDAAAAASSPPPAAASSPYGPDAPDATVGEPLLAVTANASDVAAAAASQPRNRNSRKAPVIITVPGTGEGFAAAQAVVPVQTTQVTVYEHANYAGRAGVAGVGDYRALPAEFNDMITSIRVPAGLKITLREHPNYGGRGLIITGPSDITNLSPWNFNDITSSFKIEATGTGGGGGGGGGGGSNPNYAIELLNLVNAARQSNGRAPLSLNTQLNNAAMAHSIDQAGRNTMTHTGSDGSDLGTRVTRAGYRWSTVGENVAVGQTSPSSVFQAWMNSPGHRANILNGNFADMGVAVATGRDGRPYWTQVFGRRM
eukprot:gene7851-8048_t